ncbi:MAG: helix-turn-helix transcriptional regulator [Dehalococcoidia bacterium]
MTSARWRTLEDLEKDVLPTLTAEERQLLDETTCAIQLGRRIRELRLAQGISQKELALRVGTSQAAIGRLELGGVEPRLGTLQRVGKALGASLTVELNVLEPA